MSRPASFVVIELGLVRRAHERDAEAIASVLRSAFAAYEPLYTRPAFAATAINAEEVRDRIREGPVWVAELQREIVGTVSAVCRGKALYVRGMAVAPRAQGRGVGEQLLDTVERYASEHAASSLELSTTPFLVAARCLYEQHGFRVVGEASLHGTPLLTMIKSGAAHT